MAFGHSRRIWNAGARCRRGGPITRVLWRAARRRGGGSRSVSRGRGSARRLGGAGEVLPAVLYVPAAPAPRHRAVGRLSDRVPVLLRLLQPVLLSTAVSGAVSLPVSVCLSTVRVPVSGGRLSGISSAAGLSAVGLSAVGLSAVGLSASVSAGSIPARRIRGGAATEPDH